MFEESIVNDLKTRGYSFLPAMNPQDQAALLDLTNSPETRRVYNEDEPLGMEALSVLGLSKKQLEDLHERVFGSLPDKASYYFIKRETKATQVSEAFRMHFDSHRFTIVVPLRIPLGGGRFVAFPLLRDEPKIDLLNILQKIWFRRFSGIKAVNNLASKKRYLVADFSDRRPLIFLGRTTLHGNEPFEGEETRVTCLIHAFDPDERRGIGFLMRKIRGALTR